MGFEGIFTCTYLYPTCNLFNNVYFYSFTVFTFEGVFTNSNRVFREEKYAKKVSAKKKKSAK